MAAIPDKIKTWQMVQPTTFNKETKEATPGKLEKTEIPVGLAKSWSKLPVVVYATQTWDISTMGYLLFQSPP